MGRRWIILSLHVASRHHRWHDRLPLKIVLGPDICLVLWKVGIILTLSITILIIIAHISLALSLSLLIIEIVVGDVGLGSVAFCVFAESDS